MVDQKKEFSFQPGKDANHAAGLIAWAPPVPNWNPWTSCNIDEGHMATVSSFVYLKTQWRISPWVLWVQTHTKKSD